MKRVTLPCAGLATDPNPYITAAQGGLRRADEVIIKHPNVASLRPSFPVALSLATDTRPRAMHVYQGTPVVSSFDSPDYYLETVSGVLDSDATPPDVAISPVQFVEARDNLYYTTAEGVRKITGPAATGVAAGLLETPSPVYATVSSGSAVLTAMAVAYRACVAREDANGVVVRSAPSPWFVVDNTTGGDIDVAITVMINGDVVAGDIVEVYRSLAVATTFTPSDVLFLAQKTAVEAGDVAVGLVPITDATPESALGAELYTNSTREGALMANYPPPAAVALARFSNCVWYGNTTDRQTLGIRFKLTTAPAPTNPSPGISAATADATGTSGTNTITIATQAGGGLHEGMYVHTGDPDAAGAYFAAGTTITNIAGSTLTLSQNLIGSPAGASVRFSDRITVDGTNFYTQLTTTWSFGSKFFPVYSNLGSDPYGHGKMARIFAAVVSETMSGVYAYGTEDVATCGTVVLRREAITGAAFTVTTSAPEGSIEALAADGSLTSSALIKPNRIYYSKPDEPEHVPLVNYVSAGAEGAAIYAMARSRDALIVFKSDGVFKVTGSAPDNWRVDEIDSTTRVLRGSCVSEMGGLVYAWTNRGAVAVSELGVQLLSARRISRELDPFAFYMSEEPATEGCYVTTWPDAGLVLFGVPDGEGSASTSNVYVYSESTGAWSRWVMSTLCAAHDRDSIALYIANSDGWRLGKNSIGATEAGTTGYDTSHTIVTWTLTDTSIEILIADADGWVPEVGDWLSTFVGDDQEFRQVTGVADNGTKYEITISSTFSDANSALTAYEAIRAAIEWQPHSVPEPFATALFNSVQVALEVDGTDGAGDLRWSLGGSNEHASAAVTKTVTSSRAAARRTTLRAGLDREVGRGAELAPYLSGSNVFAPWHCRGVTVVFAPDGGDADRGAR